MWDWPEHMTPPQKTFPLIYLAEVVDNVDPDEATSGRVQVRVWPMMRGIPEAVLPWAAPAFGLFEGGMLDGGAFTVPNKNARVYVFFAAGDVRSPVYFAAAPSMTDGPSAGTRDADLKVWKTRSGHVIEIDDASGGEVIKITHMQGSVIDFDKDGNIKITSIVGEGVQLGAAGGTLRKLLNELAASVFNAHGHDYIAPAGPLVTGTPVTGIIPVPGPPTNMGATEETADTKAS